MVTRSRHPRPPARARNRHFRVASGSTPEVTQPVVRATIYIMTNEPADAARPETPPSDDTEPSFAPPMPPPGPLWPGPGADSAASAGGRPAIEKTPCPPRLPVPGRRRADPRPLPGIRRFHRGDQPAGRRTSGRRPARPPGAAPDLRRRPATSGAGFGAAPTSGAGLGAAPTSGTGFGAAPTSGAGRRYVNGSAPASGAARRRSRLGPRRGGSARRRRRRSARTGPRRRVRVGPAVRRGAGCGCRRQPGLGLRGFGSAWARHSGRRSRRATASSGR